MPSNIPTRTYRTPLELEPLIEAAMKKKGLNRHALVIEAIRAFVEPKKGKK